MWCQGACNLLATLSKPPWRQPLNWSLHMTIHGEERIPFHSYVQPKATQSCHSPESSSFPDFRQLPAELQLRILTFCSAPTLYQLMRTSIFRTEAEKLFWSDPNTYYLIDANWLVGGGHSGRTLYDLSFMAYAQNVEIEYDMTSENDIGPIPEYVLELDYAKVSVFWKSFQARFPRAKRVVFNQVWKSFPIRQHDDEPVGLCLRALIEASPVEIDVSAFVIVGLDPGSSERTAPSVASDWHRGLYKLAADGKWEVLTSSGFERKTIFMPPKKFHGPVGEFEGSRYGFHLLQLQHQGLGALVIEALDRHYFDKEDPESFHCPMSGCNVYFEKAGQWTQHAAEEHIAEMVSNLRIDILPDALQYHFEERKNAKEQKIQALQRQTCKMYDGWNKRGAEKRRAMERGWIYQLENDESWDTGKKGTESELWKRFTKEMDPTWNGA